MNDSVGIISTDHIQIDVTVRLGKVSMTIAEVACLRPDDVITLDQSLTEGVEICIGDKVIARGELTSADSESGLLCVRITGAAQ